MSELDYPVAAPVGVEPIIFRAQIIQNMAARYKAAMPDMPDEAARDAAMATWETDWPDDPAPRTLEAAIECVDDDLALLERRIGK